MSEPRRADDGQFRPGDLVSRTYRIERHVGGGGMGEVYRATNVITGSSAAVKVMLDDHVANPMAIELFRREATILQKVKHEVIVSFETALHHDHLICLVMEFVEGVPLGAYYESHGPLPAKVVLDLGAKLASGLKAVHDAGVAHRDLSPDNILLRDGDVAQPVIIDFGIAKSLEPSAGTIIGKNFAGKVRYASPEQLGHFGGDIDARTDVYSLGLVMAEISGAALPQLTSDYPAAFASRAKDVALPPGTPAALKKPLSRMLIADPQRREADIVKAWTPPRGFGIGALGGLAPASPAAPVAAPETRAPEPPPSPAPHHHSLDPPPAAEEGPPSTPSGRSRPQRRKPRRGRFSGALGALFIFIGALAVLAVAAIPILEESGVDFRAFFERTTHQSAQQIAAQPLEQAFSQAIALRDSGDPESLDIALGVFIELRNRGHALSAREVAQMYDPNFWSPRTSPFPEPNRARARTDYLRAAELGDAVSRRRAEALDR